MAEGISIGGRPAEDAPAPWEAIPSEPGAPAVVDLTAYGEGLLAQARADARGKASARSSRASASVLLVAPTVGAGLAEHSSPPAASLHVLSSLPAVCRCRRDLAARASWSPFRPSGMPSTARGRRLPAHRHPARALLRAFAHPSQVALPRPLPAPLPLPRSRSKSRQRVALPAICPPRPTGLVGGPGLAGLVVLWGISRAGPG